MRMTREWKNVLTAVEREVKASRPADGNAMAKDLGKLCERHNIIGAVLISFTRERVIANYSAENDEFLEAMDILSDQILLRINDGTFDPEPSKPKGAKP